MKRPLTDEDLQVRAAMDGRVAFAAGAFVVAAGLIALLDRAGAPPRLVAVLGPGATLCGLALIGVLLRNMLISRFYAAGRATPAAYAGLAFASLAAGLFMPFVPPASGGPPFGLVLPSFGGGLACAALISGPLLRRSGAFSIPDMIATRFPNIALRLGIVAVVAAAGLMVATAGFLTAAGALAYAANIRPVTAALLTSVTVFLILAPGGVAGLVWAAAGGAGILLAGLALPLGILAARGQAFPLPIFGDSAAWSAVLTRLGQWNGETGVAPTAGSGVVVAIVIGIGSLGPLLIPATATGGGAPARAAGFAGLFWCAVFTVCGAAIIALSTLAADSTVFGVRPEALPAAFFEASRAGLLAICGGHPATPAAARALCAAEPDFPGLLSSSDIKASGIYLMLALPSLRGLGDALSGLAAAGVIAAALVLSASGVQAFATAVGHDMFYRVRDVTAMTSRRLAAARLLIILGIAGVAAVLAPMSPDPRALIGLAIVFSASTVMPLLTLSIWPRANGVDAAAALLAGLATAEAFIFINGGIGALDGVGRAAVAACAVSTLTGFLTSFLHPANAAGAGAAFVHDMLRGDGDMANPDRGA